MAVSKLSKTVKNTSGTCTSSYGSIEYTRYGDVVMLKIIVTNVAGGTSDWTTICTDAPKIRSAGVFDGVNSAGNTRVSIYITGTTVRIYGAASVSTQIVYLAD